MSILKEAFNDTKVSSEEMYRRECLLSKGNIDLRGAIISLVQAQSDIFVFSAENMVSGLVRNFAEISDEVLKISDEAKSIRQILTKTRLLSINAAIEAAHVGQAGKGFGVVADEIGVLAGQTQECTDDVDSISRAMSEQSKFNLSSLDKLNKAMITLTKANDLVFNSTHSIIRVEENGFILTTLAKRMENHADFLRKLVKNTDKKEKVADHHTCAFGKWYDSHVDNYRHLNGFTEIYDIHRAFHTRAIEFNEYKNIEALTNLVMHSSEIVASFVTLIFSFEKEMESDFSYFNI